MFRGKQFVVRLPYPDSGGDKTYAEKTARDSNVGGICDHNFRVLCHLRSAVDDRARAQLVFPATLACGKQLRSQHGNQPVGDVASTVGGKTQTIYPWDSWEKTYTAEPPLWFHDIFRPDGTPYDSEETEFIRQMTQSAQASKS
jgi:hypothetical protein